MSKALIFFTAFTESLLMDKTALKKDRFKTEGKPMAAGRAVVNNGSVNNGNSPPSPKTVFGKKREIIAPPFPIPNGIKVNEPNIMDGLSLLKQLPDACVPLVFFDPQYRGVLDYQKFGNEGKTRGRERSSLPQMREKTIIHFVAEIGRVLIPSGHLFLWVDKFHLCSGIAPWIVGTDLFTVDMVVWDKKRLGMGYRTRRTSESLVIIQKAPKRAKGVWKLHDIPDVWPKTKENGGHTHRKPTCLQSKLIEAVTNRNDYVVDPASGSYSVLQSCQETGRNFIGCDIIGTTKRSKNRKT